MISKTQPGWRPWAALTALLLALSMITFAGGNAAAVGAGAGGNPVAKTAAGKMVSTIKGTASDGSKVGGTFTPLKFKQQNGASVVKGVIRGVITHPSGAKEKFTALRTMTVKKINGTKLAALDATANRDCNILNLVLGPLDLNLLGLKVHLNQVVLNITGATGAGQLLGNLLCGVAGLLDGTPLGGLLGQLTTLLNQILGQLGLGV